ncbi:hypothetical protein BOW53_00925 [Solemya pervernicosa gill symbiont]|uniref:dTDP-4-dehydro-6-deoxy-alpha-D-glucopyranose 2,3-dehydratase domain-containing protein n=2 Tax=Gammaproteobacteria incertae sedis TaxID=118884 RepID=A0A1T2LAU9_9GAMM|nr:NDP-hexose 2,3-dehydratase family protein [Candidatus Reidiella endopervernicosa]OOZ42174.1 hypothetical protein BOW53_00925 [Solemya pervernicosa gill symbiont]QKQ27257.1 NDP-hexose 2,3-dehydratase family protein [Candidatus Reidiella endopervernicosa]
MTNLTRRINFSDCDNWQLDRGVIRHDTGRFFSIACIQDGNEEHVMIDQPEIGLLGYLLKEESGELYWLVQHKEEPGNAPISQLSPTVQATRSNYEQVHKGKSTPFLEYFTGKDKLAAVSASEQGSKFLNKFNRNEKVLLSEQELSEHSYRSSNHEWLSTSQIKAALRESYSINTDARSVIATSCWDLLFKDRAQPFSNPLLPSSLNHALARSYQTVDSNRIEKAFNLLKTFNSTHRSSYSPKGLEAMEHHTLSELGIETEQGESVVNYFDVQIPSREVTHWQQPLLMRNEIEECLLYIALIDGTAMVSITAYPEPGFNNRVEFGPSMQSGKGGHKYTPNELSLALLNADLICSLEQTDEGGRFYQNRCRYGIAVGEAQTVLLKHENSCWVTLGELEKMTGTGGVLTNELRTNLSLLLAYS